MKTEAQIRKFIRQLEDYAKLPCHRPVSQAACLDCFQRMTDTPLIAAALKWVLGESAAMDAAEEGIAAEMSRR